MIAGTLVHRMVQHCCAREALSTDELVAVARELLRAGERVMLDDEDGVVELAVGAWRRIRERDDVIALFAAGQRLHEVPFSLLVPGTEPALVLRGTIDCLVSKPDGSVTVLEFKTGRRRQFHQRQLDLYVEAARACFPGALVDGVLVYP